MGEKANEETLKDELATRFRVIVTEEMGGETFGETFNTQLRGLFDNFVNDLKEDDEFVRKIRFQAEPTERKIVGSKYARWEYTISDIEFLYDLMTSARANRLGSGPSDELENTFRAISDAHYVDEKTIKQWDKKAIDNVFPRIPISMFHGGDKELAARGEFQLTSAYRRAIAAHEANYRAMDTAESGFGSQLIGNQYVGELWAAAARESRVMALLPTFEMTDPTAFLPVEVDFPELLFVSESSASNSSNYTTSKTGSQRVQVDAKKFVIHQMWSGEMEEDSIIPFIPFLRRQATKSLAYFGDSLVLNGDDTNAGSGNINLDDADPDDTKHYLAFDGVRHVGLIDNTGNQKDVAGPITYKHLTDARGRMMDMTDFRKHDWGHPLNPDDLVFVSDPETADRIAGLDEVITVDKMGEQATVLTGQQARIGRNPLISSAAMSKTEADGKLSTTGSNNIKGQVAPFNRMGFTWGWRRRIKVETERLPATDQSRIVYSLRAGLGRFTPTGAASGIEAADVIFNIDLT